MNTRGFSLVEIMVGIAMVFVVVVVMVSVLRSQNAAVRYLAQKSLAGDLREQLKVVLETPETCSCQFDSSLNWNPTVTDGSITLNLKKLKIGCAPGSPVAVQEGQVLAADLSVAKVEFAALKPTGVQDEWTGSFLVSFAAAQGGVIAPIEIGQKVVGHIADTGAANGAVYVVKFCKSMQAPTGMISMCPPNAVLVGQAGAPGTFCIQTAQQPPATFLSAKFTCGSAAETFGVGHICDHSEFYTACRDGVLGANPVAKQEWVESFDGQSASIVDWSLSGCDGLGVQAIAQPAGYRCCWR